LTARQPRVSLFSVAAWRRGFPVLLFTLGLLIALSAASPAWAKYASMVVDADTGEVLHSVNADNRNYPASLTKMMTLYLLFDQIDSGKVRLTDEMPVSAHAAGQAPSKLNLRPGQTLVVEDAILGLCTKSANDAAVTVGEFLGGTEPAFAEMMTRKAHELGMRQTTFRNASGLPNLQQMTSARDMATLARALMHNHPREYHYFSTKNFTYNGAPMHNHNHLMDWYEGTDGIKTGYIAASGFNLVASVKRDGRRLIGVVFGGESGPSRDKHMAKLLDAAFAQKPGSAGVELSEQQPEPKDQIAAVAAAAAAEEEDAAPVKKVAVATRPVVLHQLAAVKAKAKPAPQEAGDADEDDTAEDDNWAIQVGAFSQQAKARQAANAVVQKLGKLLEDGDVSIAKHKKGGHAVFLARVTGLPEDAARAACKRLAKSHAACSVLSGGVKVASR